MYNAVLRYEGEGGVVKDFNSLADREDGSQNRKHMEAVVPLLAGLSEPKQFYGVNGTAFNARIKVASSAVVLDALKQIKLYSPDQLSPTLLMMEKSVEESTLHDWAIIVPELDETYQREVNGVKLSIVERRRRKDRPGYAGSERRHRAALEVIAGKPDRETEAGPEAAALATETRGAILLTFAFDPELTTEEAKAGERPEASRIKRSAWPEDVRPEDVATLLSLAMPYGSAPRGRIGFGVQRDAEPNSPIVDLV